MLFPIKNIEELENLNELVTLQNQVKAVRLQDKLGRQNFQKVKKKLFEPVTESIKDTSEEVTKIMTESSIKNNQALENLNIKLLEIMKDRGKIATYFCLFYVKSQNLETLLKLT